MTEHFRAPGAADGSKKTVQSVSISVGHMEITKMLGLAPRRFHSCSSEVFSATAEAWFFLTKFSADWLVPLIKCSPL